MRSHKAMALKYLLLFLFHCHLFRMYSRFVLLARASFSVIWRRLLSVSMLTALITVFAIILPVALGKSAVEEACSDRFCPVGMFCDIHDVPCSKPPCKPMTICLPDNQNGCEGHSKCPPGEVCVEHRTSCISRSCKKEARCAVKGTCDATECPPSQKCVSNPTPHCVKITTHHA